VRILLIIIVISIIMGISVALGINKLGSRHIEQNLSPPKISLTDELLTEIYNRLLNIEKELVLIRKKGDYQEEVRICESSEYYF